jgi:hypothetical protein
LLETFFGYIDKDGTYVLGSNWIIHEGKQIGSVKKMLADCLVGLGTGKLAPDLQAQ